ncbi:MAG: extracellular solute-binding protein [Anaerolineae bacterium]|nr:extracellular solute-binding protein [Anaerolineae bacterium]
MNTKRLFLLIFTLALVACGGKDEESTPTPEPTQAPVVDSAESDSDEPITIRFAVNEFSLGNYAELVTAFEEEHPNINIRLISTQEILDIGISEPFPDDAALRLVQSADVLSNNVPLENFAQTLRDLTPFLDSDSSMDAADFYPDALATTDGALYVLPTTLDFNLIYYDKAKFDEAGLAYPEPGWTWDDFRTLANALTKRSGDEVTQWGFAEANLSPLNYIIGRLDSPLVNTNTDPYTPRYEDDDVAAAIDWYTSLYLDDQVAPYFEPQTADSPESFQLPDGFQLINDGKAAMWPDVSANFAFRNVDGNTGVVPFPVDSADSGTTPMFSQGLVMSAGTVNPAAAWEWISFLSSQEQPDFAFGGTSSLPARQSVANASGYWDDIDLELGAAIEFAVNHALDIDFVPGYGPLRDAVIDILNGDKTLEDALADAQTAAEDDIAAAESESETIEPFTVVSDSAENGDGNRESIIFTVAGGAFDLGQYRDLANEFETQFPDYDIEVRAPNFNQETLDLATLAQGADCFISQAGITDPQFRATLLPLNPFVDADAAFDLDDFYPALLNQFQDQGQLWGLPAELNPTVLEYNRELFDAAGVDYPEPGWSIGDFLDAAIALTAGDGEFKTYGFVPDAFELNTMLLMLERQGAQLVDESDEVPTMAFTDPSTVEALRWYAGLSSELGIKPAFATDPADLGAGGGTDFIEREGMIDEGRAGMWTTFGPQVGGFGLGNRETMDIGVASMPRGRAGGGGFTSANGYYINADTQQRRGCWEWITFLSESPDAVTGLPGRISVAESAEYRNKVGAERAAAYLASISDAEDSSIFRLFSGENDWMGPGIFWLGRAHAEVIDGELTVEEALENAQLMFEDYRACIIANDGIGNGDVQDECLEEVDPSLNLFFGG